MKKKYSQKIKPVFIYSLRIFLRDLIYLFKQPQIQQKIISISIILQAMVQNRLSLLFFLFLFSRVTFTLQPIRLQLLHASKVKSLAETDVECQNCKSQDSESSTGRLQKVGVYYGNWNGYGRNFQICNVPGDKIDYLFYSFLDPSTGVCQFSDPWLDLQKIGPIDGVCGGINQAASDHLLGNMYQLKMLKHRFPTLKVIASIGGWSYSNGFHNYIGSPTTRTALVSSCVKLLNTYSSSFDGFDIDLEYPCLTTDVPCGDNITPTSNDKGNFAALIQEFRNQMGPTPYLSIATSADQTKIKALDFPNLDHALNSYHIMTYDFTGGEYGDAYSGHHTQLNPNPEDPDSYRKTLSAANAAKTFVANGASPSKINIGAAFYGKSFKIAINSSPSPFVKSLGAPTIGTWDPAVFDYYDIINNYLTNSNGFYDSVSEAAYILDKSKGLYITYDNPKSIMAKTSFVRQMGYQGVFAWQVSSDSSDFQLTSAMGQ